MPKKKKQGAEVTGDSSAWEEECLAISAIYEDEFSFDEREHRQYRIRVSPSSTAAVADKMAVLVVSYVPGYPRRPPGDPVWREQIPLPPGTRFQGGKD